MRIQALPPWVFYDWQGWTADTGARLADPRLADPQAPWPRTFANYPDWQTPDRHISRQPGRYFCYKKTDWQTLDWQTPDWQTPD